VLSPGAFLSDRYQLTERIAAGGMGEVWRGEDTLLHRPVAVKVVLPGLMADQEFLTRFRTEARMMAALRHPGIVQVYDYGESAAPNGGRLDYLIMEYIEGVPLSKRIEQAGRLGPDETLAIVAQVADALQVAHQAGIVHRDVKPANLLVRPGGAIVLVDFGVARSAAGNGLTGTNVVLGSVNYMAPEQAEGKKVTPATDVYALGAVAYCCLTGRPPYVGDNPLQVMSQLVYGDLPSLPRDVPPPVAALVLRAIAKDPAQRFASAAEMASVARAPGRMNVGRPPTQQTRPIPPQPGQTSGRVPLPGGPQPGFASGRMPAAGGPPRGYQTSGQAPIQGYPATGGTRPMSAQAGGYQPGRAPTGPPQGNRAASGAASIPQPAAAVASGYDSGSYARSDGIFGDDPGGGSGGGSGRNRGRNLTIAAAVTAVVLGLGGVGIAIASSGGGNDNPTATGSDAPVGAAVPSTGGKSTKPTRKPTRRPTTAPTKPVESPAGELEPTDTEAVNPNKPEEVCGDGYEVIEQAAIRDTDGVLVGNVYLLHSDDDENDCTVTLKAVKVGKKSAVSAYLEPDGLDRNDESGRDEYYGGPAIGPAGEGCVKWGGTVGDAAYDNQHCE